MTIAYIRHPVGLDHRVPAGHPERPDRLRAVDAALSRPEFDDLKRIDAPLAQVEDVGLIHDAGYIAQVEQACLAAGPSLAALDADTSVCQDSYEAALRGAGAVMAGVDGVIGKEFDAAFCAMRPPGHHAERNRAMGFCLFNSIAVGAAHALKRCGLKRAAVVDIDVHHGNGTQQAAYADKTLFFASIHQGGIYPGTGQPEETGCAHNVVNAPMPAMTVGRDWRAAIETRILPALDAFAPEILLVSAGFDGHADDPLAMFLLTEDDYAWAAETLAAASRRLCEGRLVCVLEGGYDLQALEASTARFVGALAKMR